MSTQAPRQFLRGLTHTSLLPYPFKVGRKQGTLKGRCLELKQLKTKIKCLKDTHKINHINAPKMYRQKRKCTPAPRDSCHTIIRCRRHKSQKHVMCINGISHLLKKPKHVNEETRYVFSQCPKDLYKPCSNETCWIASLTIGN